MILLVALVVFLVVYNNATNLLGLPDGWYVPFNLMLGAGLVGVALATGHDRGAVGLDPAGVRSGLRWAGVIALVVAAGLAALLALPSTRPFLADTRVAGLGLGGLAFQTLVRIPLGTALFEEVAFRGVLMGVWTRQHGLVTAIVGSSIAFGLWHIGPTIVALDLNGIATEPAARVLAVSGAVVVTAAAGVLFCLLRVATGGILAPILAHAAINSLATTAAYLAQGR